MSSVEVNFPKEDQPSRIKKWRVSVGTMVTAGRILLLYQDVATGEIEKKLRAPQFGRIVKLLVKDNEVVQPGQPVLLMEGCKHPTVMKDLCAECGADLRKEFDENPDKPFASQANVPMVHSVPELKVTAELAEKIGREDKERLLEHKQLVLLVDLDQTIVHTTNDNIPANMEDVYHFQLYGPTSPWYHTRLRPHTRHFLSEVSKLYELHICTFGARQYAHKVAALLDNDGKLFSHRILSRDECFDPQSKTANLKALFPCGVDMVCIIDDRDDVWQGCANLVQVKPYHFFLHTGDINVPPGLGKHDDPSPPKSLTEQALQDSNSSDNTENRNSNNEDKDKVKDTNEDDPVDAENLEDVEKQSEEQVDKQPEEQFDKQSEEQSEEQFQEQFQEQSEKVDKTVVNEKTDDKDNKNENPSNNNSENVESNQTSSKKDSKNKSSYSEKLKTKRKHGRDKKEKKKQEKEPQFNSQEMEDQDDYLLYLEDILKRIHMEFYTETEIETKSKTLREIIPKVRLRVLEGLYLTFSGLVPNNQKLHQSRAYKVARAFGAQVSQDFTEQSTHLVAIQPGTVKVREAKRQGKVKIVNPDWLWTCAERWEHVDERLYPLKEVPLHKAREFRKPPAHCSTPEHIEDVTMNTEDNFANTINPLMVFTQEEIANMDKEVNEDMSDLEDIFDDSDDDDDDDENIRKREHDSDSNDVYGYYDEVPCTKKRRKNSDNDSISSKSTDDEDKKRHYADEDDDEEEEDDPVTRFRRGEDLPDDLDLGDNSQDSVCNLEAEDMEDEREWNAMGAALEREFLSE